MSTLVDTSNNEEWGIFPVRMVLELLSERLITLCSSAHGDSPLCNYKSLSFSLMVFSFFLCYQEGKDTLVEERLQQEDILGVFYIKKLLR